MKTVKFKSFVIKVKHNGTCFIRLPKRIAKKYPAKQEIKVLIDNKIGFFCNIRTWRVIGFYVPATIAIKDNLFDKEVEVAIEKIDGFYSTLLPDGRVYLPNNLAIKLKLRKQDIILLEFNDKKEYCTINFRKKGSTEEFFCMFAKQSINRQKGVFKIKKIFRQRNFSVLSGKIHDDFAFDNCAQINKRRLLLFHGNRIPLLVDPCINIEKFAHYLGCYFADGNKKGNSWGICASTFKQAIYYKSMHERLIKDAQLTFGISYSNASDVGADTIKQELIRKWQENTSIGLEGIDVRIITIKDEKVLKRNQYGSLILREDRDLTRLYYVRMMDLLLHKITETKNKALAIDFIHGVLEGDGSVGAKRGSLIITSNLTDLELLERVMKETRFVFHKRKEGANKGFIYIGSLEIIRNISILKDNLFKFYPKRRKLLKVRLGDTGCARFLLGKSKKTSNWLIGQLKEKGILDNDCKLTKEGQKIQKNLKQFLLSGD
ncbi:MAG TPA: hypothetical protein VFF28_05130 [Candidatus Nanoarchaeia archaeon]|nr:hypothetical protein [Candidatus Nanoarchaeia archaeon]